MLDMLLGFVKRKEAEKPKTQARPRAPQGRKRAPGQDNGRTMKKSRPAARPVSAKKTMSGKESEAGGIAEMVAIDLERQIEQEGVSNPLVRAVLEGIDRIRRRELAEKAVQEDEDGSSGKDRRAADSASTKAFITEVLEQNGRLLTAPDEILGDQNENLHQVAAFFENGTLFIAQGRELDPHVRSLISTVRFQKNRNDGMQLPDIKKRVECRATEIDGMYKQYHGVYQKREQLIVQRQQEILDIVAKASSMGASDIHVEVTDTEATVDFRVDGILMPIDRYQMTRGAGETLCAAVYAMADPGTQSDASYNPYDHQFGRISNSKFSLPEGLQALRLQFSQTSYGGRYLTMRLLTKGAAVDGNLVDLGYEPEQVTDIEQMMSRTVGMSVVSGPTGSGKSTTLERILRAEKMACPEMNICSIEDPVEFKIPGVRQVSLANANSPEERRTKMVKAINGLMRHDPDVIMIGETRDHETAKLVFEAAMTGHQVWTTVHANDAIRILTRMMDIGVDAYKIFDPGVITGLVSQRLPRKLCPKCKIPLTEAMKAGYPLKQGLYERLLKVLDVSENIHVQGRGCDQCEGHGYKGRTVVSEIIRPDEAFMQFMRSGDLAGARVHWISKLGGITMMQHGLRKVARGEVDPAEIERILWPLEAETVARKGEGVHSEGGGLGLTEAEDLAAGPNFAPIDEVETPLDSGFIVDETSSDGEVTESDAQTIAADDCEFIGGEEGFHAFMVEDEEAGR